MESIWSKTCKMPEHPALAGNLETEIAVIGAGLTGILTAFLLRQQGKQVVVLEAGRVASGQTRNTTAKITAQHNLIYASLLRRHGLQKAKEYALANQEAIAAYADLIERYQIDCDFERRKAYLYARHDAHPLLREAKAADSLGLQAHFTQDTELPFPVAGALVFYDQAQFHPLKLIGALSKQLEIYENTPVQKLNGHRLRTPGGTVQAKRIVFACHYPFVNFPGFYFTRMHQERSYVLALENTGGPQDMYLGIEPDGLSFRRYGEYLLLGGSGHRTGENSWGGNYGSLWDEAQQLYPDCRLHCRWSAQDCMTLDQIPYIGKFSPTRPDWYVATGFNKWGMTSAMAAAKSLTAEICGESGTGVFSPRRFSPAAAQAMGRETGVSAKNLTKQLCYRPKDTAESLLCQEGGVTRYNGKKAGVYRKEDGSLQAVPTKCPHLGCQLAWNPEEKTWDCPCHGSRFTTEGKRITGPAQKDLS